MHEKAASASFAENGLIESRPGSIRIFCWPLHRLKSSLEVCLSSSIVDESETCVDGLFMGDHGNPVAAAIA